jgi:hypothetical protein
MAGPSAYAAPATVATTDRLTPEQLAQLASQAGFPPDQIPTAVGVALAESNGDPRARALTPFEDSRGLWQINTLAHPDLAARFDLSDPLQNAKAALEVWRSSGWRAWTTWVTGAAQQRLAGLGRAITAAPGAAAAAVVDPIAQLADLLAKRFDPGEQLRMLSGGLGLPNPLELLINGGLIVAGVLVLLVGLAITLESR